MSKFNESSYYPLKMICKSAPTDCLFGPTTFKNERDIIYPDRCLKLNATVIWFPKLRKTIAVSSYYDAIKANDTVAIQKIQELGLPLNINFGISNKSGDLDYVIKPIHN